MFKCKKLLSALLVAAMLFSLALTGCAGNSEAPAEESASDDKLSIAVLLNGTLGDKAFFDSAAAGAKLMEDKLGATTKVVEMTDDETKWLPALTDASENPDYDIIVVGTWQMTEKLEQVAPQYPDKKYIIFDSSVNYEENELPNVYSIEYNQNECAYLAGVVGALTTKTGKLGFVGGMENTVINDFLFGYIQGAKAAKPDIKIYTAYVGNFSDSARAKELTLAQINQGVDIVFQCASTAGLGVIDGCAAKDKYCIGVDSDQAEALRESDPKKADCILTSALKRVDQSIFKSVKESHEGTLEYGQSVSLGLKDNCVGLGSFNKAVTEDIQPKVKEYEDKIKSGEIKVETAFGKTTEQLEAVKESVKP